jgi:CDP-glucose 4,6-dehydratase
LLDACRDLPNLKSIVIVTTDKVYENNEWCWGYRENDRLGGHDPYSASKAASELVISSYRKSFLDSQGVLVASARAGNVVGGGDWCEDRLIPDLVRAVKAGQPLHIRSPKSTRPWQHVLECLGGYLQLGQQLLTGDKRFAEAWNFGPDPADNRTVVDILDRLHSIWPAFAWHVDDHPQPHEANLLYLDNAKAKAVLGWRPVWNLQQTLQATGDWYRRYLESGEVQSRRQLDDYMADALSTGTSWSVA